MGHRGNYWSLGKPLRATQSLDPLPLLPLLRAFLPTWALISLNELRGPLVAFQHSAHSAAKRYLIGTLTGAESLSR